MQNSSTSQNKVSPRVLIIAEAANPDFVSVPLVGWNHAKALMDITDGHLVTHIRNRNAITRTGYTEGVDFTAIDTEYIAKPLHKLGTLLAGGKGKGWTMITAIMSVAYYFFEYEVWKSFGKRIRNGEYNIVHRITPLSPTTPSFLATRCKKHKVHFVIGPLNGGVPWPKGFNKARHKEKEWLSYCRLAYKCLPYYRKTRRDASAILVASQDTLKQMPVKYHDKCFYLPENAIDPKRFPKVPPKKATIPIRAVFLGRLVPYKGPDMLLNALSPFLKRGNITLDLIGDGPMLNSLKQLTQAHEIEPFVKFHGWIKHDKLQTILKDFDILTFPSVREFGGGVILETMALGIVPIVIDYGGPGELVTQHTGFKIPIGSPQSIIKSMQVIIEQIIKNPEKLHSMSDNCVHRAHKQFTWQTKALSTNTLYNWLLNPREEKPLFPFPIPEIQVTQKSTHTEDHKP